jgi:hypothetical protein
MDDEPALMCGIREPLAQRYARVMPQQISGVDLIFVPPVEGQGADHRRDNKTRVGQARGHGNR